MRNKRMLFCIFVLMMGLILTSLVVVAQEEGNLEKSLAIETTGYKSVDGFPLFIELEEPVVPKKPDNPSELPETEAGHWFEYEYPFYGIEKMELPESPADGCIGKHIIILKNGDHPYHTVYNNAAKKAAEIFKMDVKIMSPNWDVNVQTQQVQQAINEKPDLIIYLPVDQKASANHLRMIYKAGIPVIGSNVFPSTEGMKYLIGFTGPNDWGQTRKLANVLAEKVNYKGGYGVLTHAPGGSAYYARLWGTITELSDIAPEMELLDYQTPGFEASESRRIVSNWITRYEEDLNLIVTAEASGQPIGSVEALDQAEREDIKIGGIDSSQTSIDLIKSEKVTAYTWQPPEQDGAAAVKMAADWFNGKEIPDVGFIPPKIITQENVEEFTPAQW